MRIKGSLHKVHKLRLNSYIRYIYINPIEGALISYPNLNKFPLSPNYIIKMNDITDVKFHSDNTQWFKKKGMYYFSVKTS